MRPADAVRRCLLGAFLVLTAAAEPPLPERIDAAMSAGDFRAARPLAEAWLAELRRQPDKKLETARVLHVLGSIRDRLGDHADALRLLEEAAGGYETAKASVEEITACADEAGRAALAAGEYGAAERWLTKAIAGRKAEMASHSRSALAEVLLRTGRADDARQAWEQALTEAGRNVDARCFALRGLGVHAHTTGVWDLAVSRFREAREAAAAFGPDAPAMTAALDGQIGQSLFRAGRISEAAPLLESTATWLESNNGSPDEKAAAWNNLSTLWLENGEADKAAEQLTRILKAPARKAFADSPQAITLWLNLAAALQRRGAREEGWLTTSEIYSAMIKAETLAAKHLPEVHPLRIQIALVAATLAKDLPDGRGAREAWKKAAEASQMAVAWMQQAAAWPDDARLLEFHATLDPVSPLAALAPEDTETLATAVLASQEAVPEILLSRRRWEARAGAEAVLAWRRDPDHSPGPPRRSAPDVKALRAALPADALFVNFVRWRPYKGRGVWDTEGNYGALLISPGKRARWVDLGPAPAIENRIRRLISAARDAVAANEESAGRTSISWQLSSLYNMVWAPLGIAPDAKQRVLLRADNLLHFVPWGVLTNSAGSPLCESLPDLEIIVFPRAAATLPPASRWRVLAAGDSPSAGLPEFQEPLPSLLSPSLLESLGHLKSLPGVAAEVTAIRAAAGGGVTVEVPEPNESLFSTAGGTPAARGVIHFAGHGFASEETGAHGSTFLRAGLVMGDCAAGLRELAAGHPRPASADGLLFTADAAALPLENIEAVVLSGCQTGLGHWQTGGQLTGLRHAFLTAGAGAVASTLWDLNDEAAPELVRAIYTELAAGTPPARAVWRAQRTWLRSATSAKLTPGMRAALAGSWIAEAAGWTP